MVQAEPQYLDVIQRVSNLGVGVGTEVIESSCIDRFICPIAGRILGAAGIRNQRGKGSRDDNRRRRGPGRITIRLRHDGIDQVQESKMCVTGVQKTPKCSNPVRALSQDIQTMFEADQKARRRRRTG